MFQIKDLVKTYTPKGAEPVMALRGITVDFGETGMVFILGKSGCGKSTLLHVMGGLDYPTAGELVIDGKSSKDFTKEDYDNYRNTYVGFVFQEYNLLPEFTVYENLAIALQLQGKKADKALLKEYLQRVDLEVDEKRRSTQLSGGQKQRIAIARALIKDEDHLCRRAHGCARRQNGQRYFNAFKVALERQARHRRLARRGIRAHVRRSGARDVGRAHRRGQRGLRGRRNGNKIQARQTFALFGGAHRLARDAAKARAASCRYLFDDGRPDHVRALRHRRHVR